MKNYDAYCNESWEEWQNEKTNVNILVLGNTGSGKSSLINKNYGNINVATVNDCSRGTEDFNTYNGKDYGSKINFIDSMGYEIGQGEQGKKENIFIDKIKSYISEQNSKGAGINAVWYCVSVSIPHMEPIDLDVIESLSKYDEIKGRICVVLTKCDVEEAGFPICTKFTQLIKERCPGIQIFRTSTEAQFEDYMQFGKLNEWTESCFTAEDQKLAFERSQTVSLSQKKSHMYKEIAGFTAAAAAIGAIPIPISDAFALTALQVTMAQRIMFYYGLPSKMNAIKEIVGNTLVSQIGKMAAGSIIKLIPGVGSVIGATVNAGVASTITVAMGLTISNVCYGACQKIAKDENVDWDNLFNIDFIKPLFESFLKNKDEIKKVDAYKTDENVINAGKIYAENIKDETDEDI